MHLTIEYNVIEENQFILSKKNTIIVIIIIIGHYYATNKCFYRISIHFLFPFRFELSFRISSSFVEYNNQNVLM